MRVAVVGVGGVGAALGGRLAAAGDGEVVLVARGAHLAAIREGGLRLRGAGGEAQIVPSLVTDDPAAVGPVDVVLLCVKSYHMDEAAPMLAPLLGPQTTIVTTQNGVEAPDTVAALYGQRRVMAGLTYLSATVSAPGVVTMHTPGVRFVFGELDGRESARGRALLERCQAAGLNATLSHDIRSDLWQKFLFICALAGTTATTRQPLGPVLADPLGRELFVGLMEEVRAVAAQAEVVLPPDAVERGLQNALGLPAEMRASLLFDLERGGPTELDALNGSVSRLGRRHHVATPLNDAVTAIISVAALRHQHGG